MRNSVKRWIGALLAACLVMALLPTAALATGTGKAIQLVTNDGAGNIGGGQADNIYFGTYYQSNDSTKEPVKWRVLSNANRQLFLLSDQNLDVFQYHTEEENVTWETSTMRSWLNGYGASSNAGGDNGTDYTSDNFLGSAFSDKEQTAIVRTTVVNDDNKDDTYGTNGDGGNDTTDRIFLLSIAEADNRSYFPGISSSRFSTNTAYVAAGGKLGSYMYGVGEGDRWWLRSPGFNNTMAACIDEYGGELYEGNPVNNKAAAVRPAFNLNLSSVLFTSAATADSGKSASGTDTGLTAVEAYLGNDWKLTLLDRSRNFDVSNASLHSGGTVNFSYSNAQTGTNEYISAVIEENDEITYYGRILQLDGTTNGTSGTASLSLPSGVALSDTTKLYVFNEQCNGDYKTDYASELKNIFPAPAQAPSITTTSLSGGKVGEAYGQTLAATGTAPITWSIDSGSLPAGLALSGNTISGTPATAGTFTFTVKATNSAGSDTKELSIVIQAASVGPNPDPNPNPNPDPNFNQPPVIIIPTTDQNVSASVGNTVTMRITANYAQSYQWYVDTGSGFKAIPGATGAAYTTSQVALGNNGYRYYCVARNAYGTAVSPVFTLNVLEYMGIPATGDSPQAGLWIGFAMVSFAGLAAYAALWRRKRTN
ncbi:MAG: hypothetical protein DBY06_05115 [Clostridiales bacterium]|nr:MAG: hypothetical protein DBY06_05115 [Clostridiales bacterium]